MLACADQVVCTPDSVNMLSEACATTAPVHVLEPACAGGRIGAFLRERGIRAPDLAEMWSAYASLTDPETRHAFLRTLRAVVGPGGQTVSATNRLYLARAVPSLIVWGERDEPNQPEAP